MLQHPVVIMVVVAGVATLVGGALVNNHEPTEWCASCSIHDGSTSNDPYWSYFPNGENADFGLFKLGHKWLAGTYDSLWNSDFSIARTVNFAETPLRISINNWILTNSYLSLTPHLGQMWAAVCPLDSDGDGFSNGEELGDPDCLFPGTEARTTGISDPNNPAAVPPPVTTTTTVSSRTASTTETVGTTTITTTTTTAASSTSTSAPTSGATQTTETTTSTSAVPAVTCDSWRQFSIIADDNETTFMTTACVGRGAGDPHYETVDGAFVTCDNLGWTTLIESAEVAVDVRHVSVGATTATAIDAVRYEWKRSHRVVEFGTTPNPNTTSDSELLANANGVTDYDGRNYVEVQRILTTFGTFLNVQAVFAEPTGGILLRGCPTGSPGYDALRVAESPACEDIVDQFSRYACNADVQRIGSDEFVDMAKGSQALRYQVPSTTRPINGSMRTTRKVELKSPGSLDPAIVTIIGVLVGIALAMIVIIAGLLVYERRRDKIAAAEKRDAELRAAQAAHATHYIVGHQSEPSAASDER